MHLVNTINKQPYYRRRVSTDRLNREESQLVASLEGESGPTPAGKTPPPAYPNAGLDKGIPTIHQFRFERSESSSLFGLGQAKSLLVC